MNSAVRVTLVAALPLLISLAACASASNASSPSDSPRATGPSVTTESGASSTQLESSLLTISDLPEGWRTAPVDDSSSDDSGGRFTCTTSEPKHTHVGEAEAAFATGQIETINDALDSYTSTAAARSQFAAYARYVNSCTGAKLGGYTFTIGQLSVPRIGEQSAGVEFDGSVEGVNVSIQVVYALQGRVITSFEHVNLGGGDITTTDQLLTKQIQRVAGDATR